MDTQEIEGEIMKTGAQMKDEIERKYLLSCLPIDLVNNQAIIQGYLSTGDPEIRIRVKGGLTNEQHVPGDIGSRQDQLDKKRRSRPNGRLRFAPRFLKG